MALPIAFYSAAQVRALDQRAIETLGLPGYTLMKRAGEASLRYLRARWPMALRIVIVCGGGNNGGDGYVLARFAQAAGLEVSVIGAAPVDGLRGDARQAHADFVASGGSARPLSAGLLRDGEVIVDAVLGTGLTKPVRERDRRGHPRHQRRGAPRSSPSIFPLASTVTAVCHSARPCGPIPR